MDDWNPNTRVLSAERARRAHELATQIWIDDFVSVVARSFAYGRARPATSWSPSGSVFDTQKWTTNDFEKILRDSVTLRRYVVYVTFHESVFTFDLVAFDFPFIFETQLKKLVFPQTKNRASGVWKSKSGNNKLRLRVPHK